jgi:hypothetical protein
MHIVVDQDGPVLGWIRIMVNILGDELAQAGSFREPLATEGYGMPSDQDGAEGAVDGGGTGGDDIGLRSQAGGVFEVEGAFECLFLAIE